MPCQSTEAKLQVYPAPYQAVYEHSTPRQTQNLNIYHSSGTCMLNACSMSRPNDPHFIVGVHRDKGDGRVRMVTMGKWLLPVTFTMLSLARVWKTAEKCTISVRTIKPWLTIWRLMADEAGRRGHANYTSARYHYTSSHLPDGQTCQSLNTGGSIGGGSGEMATLRNCSRQYELV